MIDEGINEESMRGHMRGKERKQANPKKKPYIKIYATPDRPPPAAAKLAVVACHYFD